MRKKELTESTERKNIVPDNYAPAIKGVRSSVQIVICSDDSSACHSTAAEETKVKWNRERKTPSFDISPEWRVILLKLIDLVPTVDGSGETIPKDVSFTVYMLKIFIKSLFNKLSFIRIFVNE